MPLIHLTLTHDAVDGPGRQALIQAITRAAGRAEGTPDTPEANRRCVVVVHDQPSGTVFFGAERLDQQIRAVFVDFSCSAGVLDAARKETFAAELQAAALATTRSGDARPITTSVIFHEIPEGQWGREGSIRRLPYMAHVAGFQHLTGIAAP